MAEYFKAAAEFLAKKKPVTEDEYKQLAYAAQMKAFTVGGYTGLEVLQEFLDSLEQAIKDGTTMEQFRTQMNDFLADRGYTGLNPWKADNIFRTNLQTAYNAGHYKSMQEPAVKKLRPYWQYVTAGDGQVRESHAAMSGRVYQADDPIWDIWYPPNGYKCRCSVISLSKRQVEQRGLTVSSRPPFTIGGNGRVAAMYPDKGFSGNPAKTVWQPDLKNISKPLREIYSERAKETTR